MTSAFTDVTAGQDRALALPRGITAPGRAGWTRTARLPNWRLASIGAATAYQREGDSAVPADGDTPRGRRSLGTDRLAAFSDGVFSIAATLLVLDIAVSSAGLAAAGA